MPGCFEDLAPTDVNYEKLPKEILRGSFEYLEPIDLQKVILVSKCWKSVADERALWKDLYFPFKCRRSVIKFMEFFQKSISSKLQNLWLDNFSFQLNDDHFINLLSLDLNCITIGNIDLFNISDEYLIEYDAELKTTNGLEVV